MTTAEFERVARRLGELEDFIAAQVFVRRDDPLWEHALRLAIAAHGQLQLELMHPDLAAELGPIVEASS